MSEKILDGLIDEIRGDEMYFEVSDVKGIARRFAEFEKNQLLTAIKERGFCPVNDFNNHIESFRKE